MLLHLLIQLILQGAHLTFDDLLHLVRQLALDILFQPSQQERAEDFMKTANHEQGLFFVKLELVLSACVRKGCVEPLLKRFD